MALSAPYDTADAILDAARMKMNDMIASPDGDILTNTQPFTQTAFNSSFRWLQRYLANKGHVRFKQEVILTGLPAVTSTDPSSQVSLDWVQYFDGTNYITPPDTPVLPPDLIQPLLLWERWSGTQFEFSSMGAQLDGLYGYPKVTRNARWEWREDALYMPGSTRIMDLRLRYAAYIPDLVTVGTNLWYNQQVPIMRCMNSLGAHIAYQVAKARGDVDAASLLQEAMSEADLIFNTDVQMKQRTNVRRQPRSGRAHVGWGW